MADISKITLLNGTEYNLKDATARASIPAAATAAPIMDGTAAVGSSAKYAKEDHVHPVDTSRAAASHAHSTDDITSGTLSVSMGGTGETTARNAANSFINSLSAADNNKVPVDDDYFISQYIGGGTTTTTYYRRPLSNLWEYIKSKLNSTVALLSGGTAIASSTDLDTLTDVGNYYCKSSTIAASLSHCPVSKWFYMRVSLNTGTNTAYPCQEITRGTDGTRYYRYKNAGSGWSNWIEYAPNTDTTYSAGDGLIQNGTTFSDHRGIEYIRGTWTEASGTWTGVSTDTELYDGKQIILYMPFAGSGNATLNLTLAGGGTTGAKNVYFESTTRFTTHKSQNSQLHLIYHSALTLSNGNTYEGWWYVANRDQTINYQMRHANSVLALEAIPQYHLACGTASGYKKVVSGVTFDVSYPLLITQAAWKANATYTNGYFEYQDQSIRNTIAALGSSYAGLTANSMIYLVGTLSGTTFTVDSSLVTCTEPSTADGKAYIPLGIAYSTYQFYFYSQRLVYEYSGGSFHEVAIYARDSATVSGHTVAADVPSDAKFTDTTYESKAAASGGTAVSLVTTGEKYTWNNKQNKVTASGVLKGNGSGTVSAATKGTDYGALSFTVSLTVAGWSSNAQTITNSNFVTSGYAYIVTPASGSYAAYAAAQVYADDVTTASKMKFHCVSKPSAALTVNVLRVVSA